MKLNNAGYFIKIDEILQLKLLCINNSFFKISF